MSEQGLRIELARSGGVAGITVRSALDTAELPPDEARRVETMLDEIDLSALPPPGPRAGAVDRFQYDLVITRGGRRQVVSVGEKELTPALRRLVQEVLARRQGGKGRAPGPPPKKGS